MAYNFRINPLECLNIVLGLALLHFLILYTVDIHTSYQGWPNFLDYLLSNPHIHLFTKYSLSLAKSYPMVSATISMTLLALTSIFLLISFSSISAYLSMISYFIIWSTTLGLPGFWFFEFLTPVVLSVILILGYFDMPKLEARSIFGVSASFYDSYFKFSWVTLLLCIILFYFGRLSLNGGDNNLVIMIIYILLAYSLLQLSYALNRYRVKNTALVEECETMNDFFVSLLLYAIGAMLVFQVIDNYFIGWFTKDGYRNLVQTYSSDTHKTFGLTQYFLTVTANYSGSLYKVQAVVETIFAIGLCLRFFVFPILLGATGLIGLLTWIEFGVSPTWPPVPGGETNWLWELLLTTVVMIFCIVSKLNFLKKQYSLRAFIFDYSYQPLQKIAITKILINTIIIFLISIAVKKLTTETGLVTVLIDSVVCLSALSIISLLVHRYRQRLF